MTDSSYRAWGIALALAGVVSFSFRPILIKLAYGYVTDPVTLIALRMVFSLPFFVAMALWLRRDSARTALTRGDWWSVLFLGFLGYYLASFLDFLGLQYISAGVGRLVLFLYPTITVLLSALFLGKRVNARELVALIVSYTGLALVLAHAFGGDNRNLLLGALLVLGSAVCYAVYLVSSSQVVQRIGSIRFTAYATSVASVLCIAQFLLLRPLSALDLPPQVYGLAAAMGVLCTVLPVFMTSEALKRIGANQVAIIGAAGPVTTIFFGWVGLEESMTLVQIAGAVLVLAGVLLVTINQPKAHVRPLPVPRPGGPRRPQ
ncbi:MAG: EamA family transporter [Betaproteobacteria bacterium]|nr:MAG: EamA family transporter [Betaproteobacteria bacterium]